MAKKKSRALESDPESERGLYRKFKVVRSDGSSGAGGKHERCRYFVLDLEHDRHARPALIAYIKSCKDAFPALARDLRALLRPVPQCGCRSAGHDAGCGLFFSQPESPRFGR